MLQIILSATSESKIRIPISNFSRLKDHLLRGDTRAGIDGRLIHERARGKEAGGGGEEDGDTGINGERKGRRAAKESLMTP